jgi:hypothetical protein
MSSDLNAKGQTQVSLVADSVLTTPPTGEVFLVMHYSAG